MTESASQMQPETTIVWIDGPLEGAWGKHPEVAEVTLDAHAFDAFDAVLALRKAGADLPRADFDGFRLLVPDTQNWSDDDEAWLPFELPLTFKKASVTAQGFYVEAYCKQSDRFFKAGPLPFEYVKEQERLWRAQELVARLDGAMSDGDQQPEPRKSSGPAPL